MPDAPELVSDLFRIDWNRHSAAQWQTMLDNCARSTLTQSPAYAAAFAKVENGGADYGLIRFQGTPIGMAIVTRRRGMGGVANYSLYRGPVWIHDEIPGEMLKLALRQLRRRFRWWRGRPLNFHPELSDKADHRRVLSEAGFRRVAEGYATIWLDLSAELEALRADQQSQWRNQLSQAERAGVETNFGTDDDQFEWLYDNHASHMAEHDYRGPSPALLRALHDYAPDEQKPRLLIAQHDGAPIAAILVCPHGNSATYLVGWTGEVGRRLRAHNLLLWRAVEHLKAAGIRWFDLGGINAEATGVAHFKQGLGGEAVTLVGGYV